MFIFHHWRVFAMLCALGISGMLCAQVRKPAILFAMGAHNSYIIKPLVAQGFTLDTCKPAQLSERLASGKFNVVVVSTLSDEERKALDAFMARGGGVFACNPEGGTTVDRNWTKTNEWLTQYGARPRWEIYHDSDAKNVVRDILSCQLSWSDKVLPPVNDGVTGVLTILHGSGDMGSFDLEPAWTAVVRGAATMNSAHDDLKYVPLQPWMPAGFITSPPLLAIREANGGRMAVMGLRSPWIFNSPGWCPTVEAMLSTGCNGKASGWLQVIANTFRWLAAPSLHAGMGGAITPETLLNPPPNVWPLVPKKVWDAGPKVVPDHAQYPGLVGARTALSSGTGTVAEYVQAAKAAHLSFIVFLEDELKMDETKWQQLVTACTACSDATFAAIPGLTYEDAQGNHLYAFADRVRLPTPALLLPDRRLATTKEMRSRAYFDYVDQLMEQDVVSGFWNHRANFLPPADYKLYDSFPIYSTMDGKPVDDAFTDYQYLMSIGGGQNVLAFEFMTSPAQVAERARQGWRVVSYHEPDFLRSKWKLATMSFSGMNYPQYITQGPTIPVWETTEQEREDRMAQTHGEWWRPDIEEYRLHFRVASDVGLKSVTLYDGERVFRRWLPDGGKSFEQELVLANAQQHGFYLVAEDTNGKRAVSMEFWTRNLLLQAYILQDRCNFQGDARLRTKTGEQYWTSVGFNGPWTSGIPPNKGVLRLEIKPAIGLTPTPTIPMLDGEVSGFFTKTLFFNPEIPGELRNFFSLPSLPLIGRELAIGQGNYQLGYDPAEENAKVTPLGYPYQQPQAGIGNAWGSWHHLIPTRKVKGWERTYICNYLPPDAFRIGWLETKLEVKDTITIEKEKGFRVMYAGGNNWTIYQDGKPVATPEQKQNEVTGPFRRGTLAVLEDKSGAILAIPMDDQLTYHYYHGGTFSLFYAPAGKTELGKGDALHYTVALVGGPGRKTSADILDFAGKFGVIKPGAIGYTPVLSSGKTQDNYLVWQLAAENGEKIEAKLAKVDLHALLPVCVTGLHENWSVFLLDRARKGINFRALSIIDGASYAQLDLADANSDIFIGHPLTCNLPEVKLMVSWQQPGVWFVEAHNPTEFPLATNIKTTRGWTLFSLNDTVTLKAGESKIWRVKGR